MNIPQSTDNSRNESIMKPNTPPTVVRGRVPLRRPTRGGGGSPNMNADSGRGRRGTPQRRILRGGVGAGGGVGIKSVRGGNSISNSTSNSNPNGNGGLIVGSPTKPIPTRPLTQSGSPRGMRKTTQVTVVRSASNQSPLMRNDQQRNYNDSSGTSSSSNRDSCPRDNLRIQKGNPMFASTPTGLKSNIQKIPNAGGFDDSTFNLVQKAEMKKLRSGTIPQSGDISKFIHGGNYPEKIDSHLFLTTCQTNAMVKCFYFDKFIYTKQNLKVY